MDLGPVSSPEQLGRALGAQVIDVAVEPYATKGWSASDSAFSAVAATMADGRQARLVLKTSSWDTDWMMRGTRDRLGRAARIWEHGLLAQVPDAIDHATVAGWVDDSGRQRILMRDAAAELLEEEPPSAETVRLILDGAAAMHAAFFGHPSLDDPRLGLCSLYDLYRAFGPDEAQRQQQVCSARAVDMIVEGWAMLEQVADADVARTLRSLANDPAPLADALSRFPRTLVHDDLRLANVGVVPGDPPRLLLLDWARVTAAPPAVDLAWLLAVDWTGVLPWSPEETVAVYTDLLRSRLGDRFDPAWWEPQLRLALLGGAVQFTGFLAWLVVNGDDSERRVAQDLLAGWWSEQVRAARPLLHGKV
jgi:hypothetical protein